MHNIEIRPMSLADLSLLRDISIQTFSETFSAANTAENMQNYLEQHFSLEQLNAELSNPNSLFYVANCEDQTAAYLKINVGDAQTELNGDHTLEIERIYVLKHYQGRKVGQLLLNHAIQIAQQKNKTQIWLGVWEQNHKAIQFYQHIGFVEFDKHVFKLGEDIQTDLMMQLQLN